MPAQPSSVEPATDDLGLGRSGRDLRLPVSPHRAISDPGPNDLHKFRRHHKPIYGRWLGVSETRGGRPQGTIHVSRLDGVERPGCPTLHAIRTLPPRMDKPAVLRGTQQAGVPYTRDANGLTSRMMHRLNGLPPFPMCPNFITYCDRLDGNHPSPRENRGSAFEALPRGDDVDRPRTAEAELRQRAGEEVPAALVHAVAHDAQRRVVPRSVPVRSGVVADESGRLERPAHAAGLPPVLEPHRVPGGLHLLADRLKDLHRSHGANLPTATHHPEHHREAHDHEHIGQCHSGDRPCH